MLCFSLNDWLPARLWQLSRSPSASAIGPPTAAREQQQQPKSDEAQLGDIEAMIDGISELLSNEAAVGDALLALARRGHERSCALDQGVPRHAALRLRAAHELGWAHHHRGGLPARELHQRPGRQRGAEGRLEPPVLEGADPRSAEEQHLVPLRRHRHLLEAVPRTAPPVPPSTADTRSESARSGVEKGLEHWRRSTHALSGVS